MPSGAARGGQIRLEVNPLVRIAGRDDSARLLLLQMVERDDLPLRVRAPLNFDGVDDGMDDGVNNADYTHIDAALMVSQADDVQSTPRSGTGYAGLTPAQRYWFLSWLNDPKQSAPPAFQQLYVAHLECNLFEGDPELVRDTQRELVNLAAQAAWEASEALWRAVQCAFWLGQSREQFAAWLDALGTMPELLGVALGQLALLGGTLSPEMANLAVQAWGLADAPLAPDILRLRLASLTTNLGEEPLAHALAQLGDTVKEPKPWRTAHRDLRILLPQPDVQAHLEPLLRELANVPLSPKVEAEEEGESGDEAAPESPTQNQIGWHVVLEFGQSRSEYFEYILLQARKRPGYSQLLDEDRKLVYRIIFKKREMRYFWNFWEYVKGWSDTNVYVNGRTIRKWDVYPYSPFMR